MSVNFKPGDRVVDIEHGDVGTITRPFDDVNREYDEQRWWVMWDTLSAELHIAQEGIMHVAEANDSDATAAMIDAAIAYLTHHGYNVTKPGV